MGNEILYDLQQEDHTFPIFQRNPATDEYEITNANIPLDVDTLFCTACYALEED